MDTLNQAETVEDHLPIADSTVIGTIPAGAGPIYLRLADAFQSAIVDGKLKPGQKLPPQRNLAFDLGVTLGTVTRAYSVLRERGHVSGEIGRGTFVSRESNVTTKSTGNRSEDRLDRFVYHAADTNFLNLNSTGAPNVGQSETIAQIVSDVARDNPAAMIDYVRSRPRSWDEAGASFMATGGWQPQPECVIPTKGADHAILAGLSIVTSPGDRVLFESLGYSQSAHAADLVGRRPIAAELDEEGLIPEEMDRICAQQHPKAVILTPALHNPTVGKMSDRRRDAIVEVARRHNLWIIEDNVYGQLVGDDIVPIIARAPERTIFVSSLSKSVTAGLRAGWMVVPPSYVKRAIVARKLVSGSASFLISEIAARLIISGAAAAIHEKVRHDIERRVGTARRFLSAYEMASHDYSPFMWLKLPSPWSASTFMEAARNHGVLIDGEDEFKPVRSDRVHHRVRLGLSSVGDQQKLETALSTIASLLESGNVGYETPA